MSKQTMLSALLAIGLIFCAYEAEAVVKPISDSHTTIHSVFDLNVESLLQKSKAELEYEVGRKLTLKEKIALKVIRKKWKKNAKLSTSKVREEVRTDGLAIAGLVTGILGIFIFGLGILAIVFSAIALGRIKRSPEYVEGKGLAIAGLILGIVGTLTWLIVIAALVAFWGR